MTDSPEGLRSLTSRRSRDRKYIIPIKAAPQAIPVYYNNTIGVMKSFKKPYLMLFKGLTPLSGKLSFTNHKIIQL